MVFDKELDENLKVCTQCQHHFPISSRERIHSLVETCTFEEMDAGWYSVDILQFTGVASNGQARGYQQETGLKDAVITGMARLATPGGARSDGFQIPGRLNGFSRRREVDAAY